jgi:hypothetical protein
VQQPQPGAAGEAGKAEGLGGGDQGQRAARGCGRVRASSSFDQTVDAAAATSRCHGGGQHQWRRASRRRAGENMPITANTIRLFLPRGTG